MTGDLELVKNLIQSEMARAAAASAPSTAPPPPAHTPQRLNVSSIRTTSQMMRPIEKSQTDTGEINTASLGLGHQITLAGDIANVELPSIFQSISICKMTGRLNLYHQTTQGEIYFADGKIVHAILESAMDKILGLTPDQVVLELLTWQAGTFRFNPGWNTSEKTVTRRLESFLLEAAAITDYQQALADRGFDETTTKLKKDPGYLNAALNEILAAGVADLELQKKIYNDAQDITAASDLISDLPRTVWIPTIFNLINCKLFSIIKEDQLKQPELEPFQIDESLARNAERSLCRPDTGVISAPFLFYLLRLEFSRHRRNQTPLSLVMVTLPGDGFGDELDHFKDCFDQLTDEYEQMAHYDMHGGRRVVLVLPDKNLSKAYLLIVRLINRLDRIVGLNSTGFQFAIASAPDHGRTLELLLAALLHCQMQGELLRDRIISYSGIEKQKWDQLRQEGEAAYRARNMEQASDIWMRALTEAQEFDSDDARLIYTVDWLSTIQMSQKQFETAEPLLKLACELKREAKLQQELAVSLAELGKCYFEQGQLEKVETALLESIAIFERLFGCDHELVGDGVHNLATVYHLQDKTDDAGKAYQKAIQIKQTYLGRDHPETIKVSQNYSKLLRRASVDNTRPAGAISGQWRTIKFDPLGEISGGQAVNFSSKI